MRGVSARGWLSGGWLAALALATVCSTSSVRAANIAFTIDPAQSHLTLTGVIRKSGLGFSTINPQASGALTAPYGGTVVTDSDLALIVFMGGTFDAGEKGMYMPGPGAGDYGILATLPSPEGQLLGAIRNFQFAMFGSATPLFNGFDLSSVTVSATSGVFESTVLPTLDLSNATATMVAGTGTLTEANQVRKLTLPIDLAFAEAIPNSSYSLEISLSGTIIATRPIPEPATGALLLVGSGLAALRRRRRG